MLLMNFLRRRFENLEIFFVPSSGFLCAASQCRAELSKESDHAEVEDEGKGATGCEREPKSDPVAQHRRHYQEHRQRREHVPECRLCMDGDPLDIAGIMPQPENAEDRYERQGYDESPERRRAPRHLDTMAMRTPDNAAFTAR